MYQCASVTCTGQGVCFEGALIVLGGGCTVLCTLQSGVEGSCVLQYVLKN